MDDEQVQQAYASRASEYTAVLGAVDDMHELDRRRIKQWAEQISGRVIDAGCGPGHWTDFLHKQGAEISGVDLVPEFVESARVRFPEVSFQVSSLRALNVADQSIDGVLAWYSLIHMPPAELPQVLSEFRRVLSPQGHLLLGIFESRTAATFDHAVSRAHYWSVEQMVFLLDEAGFDVVEVETRQDPNSRPHAAISATAR